MIAGQEKYFPNHKYDQQPLVNTQAKKEEQPKSDLIRKQATADGYFPNHKHQQLLFKTQANKEEQTKSDLTRKLVLAGADDYFSNHKYQQKFVAKKEEQTMSDRTRKQEYSKFPKYQEPYVNSQNGVSIHSYQTAQLYGGAFIAECSFNKEPFMRLPKSYK